MNGAVPERRPFLIVARGEADVFDETGEFARGAGFAEIERVALANGDYGQAAVREPGERFVWDAGGIRPAQIAREFGNGRQALAFRIQRRLRSARGQAGAHVVPKAGGHSRHPVRRRLKRVRRHPVGRLDGYAVIGSQELRVVRGRSRDRAE